MAQPKYQAKDLRHPIVLLRANQVPSATDDTWKLNVKPYHQSFAYVEEPSQRRKSKKDADAKATYLFAIRYIQQIAIEEGDVISWEDTLYYIRETKRIRGLHEFMEMTATVQQKADLSLYEESDNVTATEAVVNAQSPFWEEDHY